MKSVKHGENIYRDPEYSWEASFFQIAGLESSEIWFEMWYIDVEYRKGGKSL